MEMEQQPTAQARAEPWAAGRRAEAKDLSDTIAILLAITIAALFVSVLLNTIAFPRGTHPDEIAKVKLILSGDNSFAHPILMLELARAANALAGLTDPQSIIELGRACAVLAGGLAVFASFLLARQVLPASAALAATIAVAVVPLVRARILLDGPVDEHGQIERRSRGGENCGCRYEIACRAEAPSRQLVNETRAEIDY
jgi:hypothetical protein